MRRAAMPREQVQGKKDAWGWRCLVDVLPQPLSIRITNHRATLSLLLIIKSLLHYFLSIDNIDALRQVFCFSVEFHAANRVDTLLGSSFSRTFFASNVHHFVILKTGDDFPTKMSNHKPARAPVRSSSLRERLKAGNAFNMHIFNYLHCFERTQKPPNKFEKQTHTTTHSPQNRIEKPEKFLLH